MYSFPAGTKEAYSFWGHDFDFQGQRGHKSQIWFPEHNFKGFRAIKFKLGTDTYLVSGNMPIHFGLAFLNFRVTDCKKVKCHIWCRYSIIIRAIKLKLGMYRTHLKPSNKILETAVSIGNFLHQFCISSLRQWA